MSKHTMITRSGKNNIPPPDELDSDGNLKDFIVNDLKNNNDSTIIRKKKKKKSPKNNSINDLFISYLLLNATKQANKKLKNNKRKISTNNSGYESDVSDSVQPRKKLNMTDIDDYLKSNDNSDLSDLSDDISYLSEGISQEDYFDDHDDHDDDSDSTYSDDSDYSSDHLSDDINIDSDNSDDNSNEDSFDTSDLTSDSKITEYNETDEENNSDTDSSNDSDTLFEYDELDQEYESLIEKNTNNSEDAEIEYFHYLSNNSKKELISHTEQIYRLSDNEKPLRFKIIDSNMDIRTKSLAISNIDKLSEMDVSTGEYSKMNNWITGLINIPFGKYAQLPVNNESSDFDKREFIADTFTTLDKAIYGHLEAKTHILQVIGKWIKNPNSGGNVLAIQGPMGNGKTTLVKDGISKALNRPFAFIALGGASDAAYFDGHCYTYEGSNWGRIVQIIQDSKCMNPVFYFDELDKISDTHKGEEIIHLLTHLTDSSQNSLFQDNYFPGIYIDLSKALFIFSYNDENRINKILKDRMYTIQTKGFNTKDKINISRNYLLPNIFKTYSFSPEEIVITDDIITKIIDKYTAKEEGVRNLNRCIETIISKINIFNLTNDKVNLSFTIKDFSLPFTVNDKHLEILLKSIDGDTPPQNMYL